MICKICNKDISKCFVKHLAEEHNISEKQYYDTYIDTEFHKCAEPKCNKEAKFVSITVGYNKCCCQKCANRLSTTNRHKDEAVFGLEKAQKTNLKLYGNVCSLHGKEQIKAKKKTWLKLYGEENPCKSDKIKTKIRKSQLKNHNCETVEEYYDYIQNQIKENLKKYGTNEDGTPKIINVFQLEDVKEKCKKTKLERHGDENYSNHEQACETLIKLYGSIFNNPKYKFDNISFDSSYELVYYIYLKDNNIDFIYHPKPEERFNYYWSGDDKIHTYYPDFIVENKTIEIKNDFILNKMKSEIETKDHAKYECMIKNNVEIISNTEIKPYIDYINQKYGNKYIEQFKINREKNE